MSIAKAVPNINVTPLIDVLLVLLIIFMVISPQKPHQFEAKIPEKPPENQENVPPDPLSLLVTVPRTGGGYKLNTQEAATLEDLNKQLFAALNGRPADRKAVFIKAPRTINFGEVVKVIDVVKAAGGSPIGLQIEALDQ
ncbi:MAG: biopolymer transporter ExbD [Acidobacteria bacterium]|nr:biopolymer transporter ExbD [Acidobacteriota bacterium]MCW5969601.1 biopolymer transporter ExbD [Blastocatellales bacterium]